ncbi:MAG: hypothetical protein COZ05_01250, partial [Armatimonadetes bacterium CG_4_10_14_3_um_filter_59_10]
FLEAARQSDRITVALMSLCLTLLTAWAPHPGGTVWLAPVHAQSGSDMDSHEGMSDMGKQEQNAGGDRAMPGMKQANPRSRLFLFLGIGVLVLLGVVMSARRGMKLSPRKLLNRQFVVGTLTLVVILIGVRHVVKKYRKPGSMTVIEAQAMDMSAMKPPVGAAPVAIEKIARRDFEAAVTYTGQVVAKNDEDIYPRVVGKIVSLPVYPGDRVQPGQLIARLDSVELGAREREAAYSREAAAHGQREASAQVGKASAARSQAEAEVNRSQAMLSEAQRDVESARAMVVESQKELTVAEKKLLASRQELVAMEHESDAMEAESEAARADLGDAQADLVAAQADYAYWVEELKREQQLVKQGAISAEEFQREKAQHDSARAKVDQVQARVRKAQAMIKTADSHVHHYRANVDVTRTMIATAEAEVDRVKARIEQNRAVVSATQAKVDQARAGITATKSMVRSAESEVKGASSKVAQMSAMVGQTAAGFTAATTVRGYTEIRATRPGVVIQRLVSPGVLVSPGTPILRIAEIDPIRLQANVAEQDLNNIQVGNRIMVTSAKHPDRPIVAKVTSVFPAVDPTARTAVVEALTPNPDKRFLPGEFITMRIATGGIPEAITVPNQAIMHVTPQATGVFYTEKQPAVWVAIGRKETGKMQYYCTMHPEIVRDKPGKCPKCSMKLEPMTKGGQFRAHRVMVTLGPTDGKRTVVLSGLNEGDSVIWAGHEKLKEGDSVFPTAWGKEGPATLKPSEEAPPQVTPVEEPAGTGHGDHAMKSPAQGSRTAPGKVYSCPMHPEIKSNKPGDCPKCGMRLEPTVVSHKSYGAPPKPKVRVEVKSKVTYTCPMHAEVKSNKPGDCPKCGMRLEPVSKGGVEAEAMYTCPMHPEVKSDKPGDCPKCGMKLEKTG